MLKPEMVPLMGKDRQRIAIKCGFPVQERKNLLKRLKQMQGMRKAIQTRVWQNL